MQVSRINPIVSKKQYKTTQNKSQINNTIPNKTELNNKQVPFKGLMGIVDAVSLGVANLIENGGLFVSFTLQDMLGTNLPRPIMGLKRNSKETGEKVNKKFALKELTREMITGPSMFLIPMGLLAIAKRTLGKASEIPEKIIKSFGDIHAENPLNKEGALISKKDFYTNTFSEIIKNAKNEKEISEKTLETAQHFTEEFLKGADNKETRKKAINKLSEEFVNISKSHAKDAAHTDFTIAKISDRASASFKNTINFMESYADDVVKKVQLKNPQNVSKYINKLTNKKVLTRLGLNIGMYAAILSFLQVIPKLYNKAEGKSNAGLKGLMKEETFNDKNLNAQENAKHEAVKDKSKPSFGSAAGVVNKITSKGFLGKFLGAMEFEGFNMSFPLLVGVMGGGILFPRIKNSKDKYDREEILRRDLVTCAVMCFGEKELRKGFSKLNEKQSGLVLASKDSSFYKQNIFKRFFDYIRPINGVRVFNTDQILSKYTNIDKYKGGIEGFCDFITGQGGNLAKVFSLTDESKSIINSLLEKEGKSLKNADNSVMKDIISKYKNSEEINKLTEMFKSKNNPWVTKAKTINARFTAFSVLLLVPVFLGFMLPWINEKATKKHYREDNDDNKQQINNINTDYISENTNTPNIFSSIQPKK